MSQPTVSISLSVAAAISTARAAIGAAQEIDRQIEEREELGRYVGLQELREAASSLDRLATMLLAASQRDLNDDGEIVLTVEGERALALAQPPAEATRDAVYDAAYAAAEIAAYRAAYDVLKDATLASAVAAEAAERAATLAVERAMAQTGAAE
jgi:hypothetical protein